MVLVGEISERDTGWSIDSYGRGRGICLFFRIREPRSIIASFLTWRLGSHQQPSEISANWRTEPPIYLAGETLFPRIR